jgi:hypothetical protein
MGSSHVLAREETRKQLLGPMTFGLPAVFHQNKATTNGHWLSDLRAVQPPPPTAGGSGPQERKVKRVLCWTMSVFGGGSLPFQPEALNYGTTCATPGVRGAPSQSGRGRGPWQRRGFQAANYLRLALGLSLIWNGKQEKQLPAREGDKPPRVTRYTHQQTWPPRNMQHWTNHGCCT